jgi:hypothetical protein
MKKIFFLTAGSLFSFLCFSQKITAKLKFEQGQTLEVTMSVKTTIAQQAMGQSIDFNVDAGADHSYKVTNTTDDNTTLNHSVQRINFSFDGMGQKRKFDSKEEKDLKGPFGKPVKDILEKKYDIIIDPAGKTLMAVPEKIQLSETDSRLAIITTMLKDVLDLVQPPQKDKASFFGILPGKEVGKGDTWTTTTQTASGTIDAAYVLSSISDSAILVDFVESSVTVTKAEMMGSETTTTMNNKSTGKIILDPVTGILREKTITTESNGNTESSFGTMPVTSKTTTVIKVRPVTKN